MSCYSFEIQTMKEFLFSLSLPSFLHVLNHNFLNFFLTSSDLTDCVLLKVEFLANGLAVLAIPLFLAVVDTQIKLEGLPQLDMENRS